MPSWMRTLRLLVAALICYAAAMGLTGGSTPFFFWPLMILGGCLELAFWLRLFGRKSALDPDAGEP